MFGPFSCHWVKLSNYVYSWPNRVDSVNSLFPFQTVNFQICQKTEKGKIQCPAPVTFWILYFTKRSIFKWFLIQFSRENICFQCGPHHRYEFGENSGKRLRLARENIIYNKYVLKIIGRRQRRSVVTKPVYLIFYMKRSRWVFWTMKIDWRHAHRKRRQTLQ